MNKNPSKLEEVLEIIKKEGDNYKWIDVTTGYECFIKRTPATGCWCGYVAVPKTHPCYGLDKDDKKLSDNIRIHGGLTFSQRGVFGFDCSHGGDYMPMIKLTLRQTGYPNWDRIDDYETYKTKEYVMEEVKSLAQQLKKLE